MTRLFKAMWQQGTVVVATSNRPPSELYQVSLLSALPQQTPLLMRCDRMGLIESISFPLSSYWGGSARLSTWTDRVTIEKGRRYVGYNTPGGCFDRSVQDTGVQSVWPVDVATWTEGPQPTSPLAAARAVQAGREQLRGAVDQWLGEAGPSGAVQERVLPVMMGRQLGVQEVHGGVAWVGYHTLCAGPRGAADFQALCRHYVRAAGV